MLSVVVPEIWAVDGRRPITCGLGFTGGTLDELRATDLLGTHRDLWRRLADTLIAGRPRYGQAERLKTHLRHQAGLTANNLGVLLESTIWDDLLSLAMASGDPSARDADVDSALIAIPEHALANRLRGTRLLEQGELTRALAALQRSVATRPSVEALNNLAETLRRLKQLDAAERAARAALAMNSKIYAVWDTLGCVLMDKGRSQRGMCAWVGPDVPDGQLQSRGGCSRIMIDLP